MTEYKFKIGDLVLCKEVDTKRNVKGYIAELNDNGTPKIIERCGDENWGDFGWSRSSSIPEYYVAKGKNLYWHTQNNDPNNYSLIERENTELHTEKDELCENPYNGTGSCKGYIESIECHSKQLSNDEIDKILGNYNNNKMTNIKTTLKKLSLNKEDKELVSAGLMNIDKEWTSEAKEYAREQMLDEYMKQDSFKADMVKVAKEINKED